MLHIVHMIQRRHPEKAGTITRALVLASVSGLLIGLGLLIA